MKEPLKSKRNKDLIDRFLADREFQQWVELDMGLVQRVRVDWDNDQLIFFGRTKQATMRISECLKTIRQLPDTLER